VRLIFNPSAASELAVGKKMKKTIIIISWLISLIIVFFIGGITSRLQLQLGNLKEEYNTASVIRDVELYIIKNKQWPKHWEDMELTEEQSKFTEINWELDIFKADRYDIMMSIKPTTRFFMTYPHTKSQLQHLYDEILIIRKGKQQKPTKTVQLTTEPPSDLE
jgi:hypothetical protein